MSIPGYLHRDRIKLSHDDSVKAGTQGRIIYASALIAIVGHSITPSSTQLRLSPAKSVVEYRSLEGTTFKERLPHLRQTTDDRRQTTTYCRASLSTLPYQTPPEYKRHSNNG